MHVRIYGRMDMLQQITFIEFKTVSDSVVCIDQQVGSSSLSNSSTNSNSFHFYPAMGPL